MTRSWEARARGTRPAIGSAARPGRATGRGTRLLFPQFQEGNSCTKSSGWPRRRAAVPRHEPGQTTKNPAVQGPPGRRLASFQHLDSLTSGNRPHGRPGARVQGDVQRGVGSKIARQPRKRPPELRGDVQQGGCAREGGEHPCGGGAWRPLGGGTRAIRRAPLGGARTAWGRRVGARRTTFTRCTTSYPLPAGLQSGERLQRVQPAQRLRWAGGRPNGGNRRQTTYRGRQAGVGAHRSRRRAASNRAGCRDGLPPRRPRVPSPAARPQARPAPPWRLTGG